MRILLTGATGYVGGRLLSALQSKGLSIKCLTRKPEYLEGRVSSGTIIHQGDVMDQESLPECLEDVDTAYYLIHSIGSSKNFEDHEILGATHFAQAAREAGVQRIIYLGGLGSREVVAVGKNRGDSVVVNKSGVIQVQPGTTE